MNATLVVAAALGADVTKVMKVSQVLRVLEDAGYAVDSKDIHLGRVNFQPTEDFPVRMNGYVVFFAFVEDKLVCVKAFSNKMRTPRKAIVVPKDLAVIKMEFYVGNGFRAIDNTEWVYKPYDGDIMIMTEKEWRVIQRAKKA